MKKRVYPLEEFYHLLEPGPVIMVTTISPKGKPNVMSMAWHMVVDFEPALIAFIMGSENDSFKNLMKTKECVINIPGAELAPTVVHVGNNHGAYMDKFKKFHLTPEPASLVKPPLIKECYAHLECKVVNMTMAKKYNLFILEAVKAWITPSKKRQRQLHHMGNGIFTIDGKMIKLPWKRSMRRP